MIHPHARVKMRARGSSSKEANIRTSQKETLLTLAAANREKPCPGHHQRSLFVLLSSIAWRAAPMRAALGLRIT